MPHEPSPVTWVTRTASLQPGMMSSPVDGSSASETSSPVAETIEDEEYFIKQTEAHPRPCVAVRFGKLLRSSAVPKDGNGHNRSDSNLLFPSSTIQRVLSVTNVTSVLHCDCTICSDLPGGRDTLSDNTLIDALTKKSGAEADDKRRLFSVILFMGAGFTARHVCMFHTRGLEITGQQEILRTEVFEPLQKRGLFSHRRNLTALFTATFKKARCVFNTPSIEAGKNLETFFVDVNLPFVKERRLGSYSNGSMGHGRLYEFEIHPEFRGEGIPNELVRKELNYNGQSNERSTLQFLAGCKQPHLIELLFWYRHEKKVNYVFKRYPGSLLDILSGSLKARLRPQTPARYRGSKLQHWLWQGAVDIIAALAFLHYPKDARYKPRQLAAAHTDLKPANILINEDGSLVVADFGHAQIIDLEANQDYSFTLEGGDYNYRPPMPLSPTSPALQGMASNIKWCQAYDVWSIACVLTEIIEFIRTSNDTGALAKFRDRRRKDSATNLSFWVAKPGGYELRASVRSTLNKFRSPQDQYLNSVTDLLERMFSIDFHDRPTMAQCLAIISQNVPTDEWPLLDDDEISICGLGTNPLLRNMRTQFARKSEHGWDQRRCKMYMLLNEHKKRVRLALEFEKELDDKTTASCVLSDSARLSEEVIKPLSLFDQKYKAEQDIPSVCAFDIIHPNLRFIFEEPMEYYHYLAAVMRQEMCVLDDGDRYEYVEMPLAKCRLRPAGLPFQDNKEVFTGGHLQIWKELPEKDYNARFIASSHSMLPIERRESGTSMTAAYSSPTSLSPRRVGTEYASPASSTGSAGKVNRTGDHSPIYRMFIFIPEPYRRYITIEFTNGQTNIHTRLDSNKRKSNLHLLVRYKHSRKFEIGNFTAEKDCPGIPIDPKVLKSKETFQASWIELEFRDPAGLRGFEELIGTLFPPSRFALTTNEW